MTIPKIALVITDLKTGGVPLHVYRLAVAIAQRGFRPHVVSLAPPAAVSDQLIAARIPTRHCNAKGPTDLAAVLQLIRHLRTIRPTLIHSFLFHANTACRIAAPLAGLSHRRLICEIQTVEIERRWHLTVGGMLHRFCACIVGNSPSVVDHLQRESHISADRIRCITGGVDLAAIDAAVAPDRETLGLTGEGPICVWVGRMDPVKGLEDLVEAFASLPKRLDARLLLVGDGQHAPAVRTCIQEHDVDSSVVMTGRRDNVAALIKLANVFVFPSYTEGMPNALLEAMAARRPIVTTNVAGCRDLIEHGRTGLLVPPRNPAALTIAMQQLLTDRGCATSLANNARARVERHYTFERCIDQYETLYRQVIAPACSLAKCNDLIRDHSQNIPKNPRRGS